jgi:hypothetical protein
VTGLALPKYTYEAAFGYKPLATNHVYTDITSFVRHCEIDRGRNHELSQVERGTCRLLLNDRVDRRFDGTNTAGAYYGNLLTANQASIETDTSGWTSTTATLLRSNTQALDGTYSLRLTSLVNGTMFADSDGALTSIVAGATYTALASFRSAVTARTCSVQIRWRDTFGAIISDSTAGTVADSSAGWSTATATAVAPATAVYATVLVAVGAAVINEIHYVDRVSLAPGTSATWWAPGIHGIKPMVKLRVSAEWNLLGDNAASVETDATEWSSATATLSRSSTQALIGTYSLRFVSLVNGSMFAGSNTTFTSVHASTAYTAMAYFRSEVTARSCSVQLRWRDTFGGIISDSASGTVVDGAGGWAQVTVSATSPANAVYATVLLTVAGAVINEIHYADCMGIFPGSGITAWSQGGPYRLFTGFVTSWPQQWADYANTDVQAVAEDYLKVLNMKNIVSTQYSDAVIADGVTAYYRMGDNPYSTDPVDSSGNGYTADVGQVVFFGQPGLLQTDADTAVSLGDHGGWITAPIGAALSGAGAMSFEAWIQLGTPDPSGNDRFFEQAAASGDYLIGYINGNRTITVTISDGVTTARSWTSTTALADDGKFHHIVWTRATNGTTGNLYIDSVLDVTGVGSGGGGAVTLTARPPVFGGTYTAAAMMNGTLDEVALYQGVELTAGQVIDHYEKAVLVFLDGQTTGARLGKVLDVVGVPTADRSLEAGSFTVAAPTSTLTATKALGYARLVEQSEGFPAVLFVSGAGVIKFYGRTHSAVSAGTFGDGVGELVYTLDGTDVAEDDADIWNEIIGTREGGAAQTAVDPTSQEDFVIRTLPLSGLLNDNDADVLTLVTAALARYKDPVTRVRAIHIHPLDDPTNLWPQVLGRDVHDAVTFKRAHFGGGGSTITLVEYVEHVRHVIDHHVGDFHTYWQLAPT